MSRDECHRTLLMMSQHLFRWWLGAVRQQAITWTSVDQDLQRHMASLGPINSWKRMGAYSPPQLLIPWRGSMLTFVRASGTGENAKKLKFGQVTILSELSDRDRYVLHIHMHHLRWISSIERRQNTEIISAQQISASTEATFVCNQDHADNITKIIFT